MVVPRPFFLDSTESQVVTTTNFIRHKLLVTNNKMSLSNTRLFDPNLNNRTIFGAVGPAGPPGPPGPPGPGSAPMTPLVEGTAFGSQDTAKELNSLGRGVSIAAATNRSTARYLPSVPGTLQQAIYGSCIFDVNRSSENALTSLSNSIATINETGIGNCQITASNVSANTSTLINTPVANSICYLSTTGVGSSSLLDSNISVNSSGLNSATMNKSVMLTSRMNGNGIDFTGATIVGDTSNVVMNNPIQSGFIASSAGQVVTMNGTQGMYIGNQSLAETVLARECRISSYDKFFMRTLRADATPPNVIHYDPVTAELTYGAEAALVAKQPTVLGGQYGVNSSANGSEVNGQNSFNNYSAGPAQLTGVTAVGNNLYAASVPASNSFTNDIFLGRTHQFTGAVSIQNSLIAANTVGNANITGITDSNMIVPRAASLTFGYAGAITGASFFSSGNVACTSDPNYSTVVSSGGTVNPGAANLVLTSNQSAGSITMTGNGNTLISSSNAATTYNWPAGINNTTVIRSGAAALTPTQGNQFAINHSSFYFPTMPSATPANASFPVSWNAGTGLVSYYNSANMSRILRQRGTTNASGQVVFNTGVISVAANSSISLTVQNASTTVAYTAQVIATAASSVTVQVFNSVNAVAGSPTATPSGASIVVHMNMSY